jgi:hypothetical protein
MRWQFKVMVVVALAFVAFEITQSQAQQFGGGFGGFGKGQQNNPVSLLLNPAVKTELKLTDEQANKVNDAVWVALAKVLDTDQLKRLKQIDYQQRDYRAFSDPEVQKTLKMTDDQKSNLKTILEDFDKTMADLTKDLKGGKGGFDKGSFEKLTTLATETKDKCTGVLTKEQKRIWTEMLGDKFEFPAFGKKGKGG